MAKGKAMGLWKGKVGSNVFYKIKNSNNAQKQGIRERIYDVANPQSNAQATQRMKLNPANRLAAALKSIIERGFEGVKYGSMSRQAFMKYALAMNSGYPAVPKDNSIIYPGSYLIARGSLPVVNCSFVADDTTLILTSLIVNETTERTIGAWAQALLDNNAFLKEGDQVTFVYGFVTSENINSPIIWGEKSFYLDPNDQTEVLSEGDVWLAIGEDGELKFNTDREAFAAAAVVISRESSVGGHLRSNATLIYNSIYAPLFTDAAYEEARQTYQKKNSALNSDWPTVDDGSESGGTDPMELTLRTIKDDTLCGWWPRIQKFIVADIMDELGGGFSCKVSYWEEDNHIVEGSSVTLEETMRSQVTLLTAEQAATLARQGYVIDPAFIQS